MNIQDCENLDLVLENVYHKLNDIAVAVNDANSDIYALRQLVYMQKKALNSQGEGDENETNTR